MHGVEDIEQKALVNASHVRDFTEGAAAQPAVTAAARRRKTTEDGAEWDRYLVQLLTEIFLAARDVILVLDTAVMAERWWPQWQKDIGRQMMPPGGGKPRVVVGMSLDDVQRLLRGAASEQPARRRAPQPKDAIASLDKAFSSWARKRTSRLVVLAQLKDDEALHFASESEGGGSLMKAFKVGKEIQKLGIKCFLVLLRNAFGTVRRCRARRQRWWTATAPRTLRFMWQHPTMSRSVSRFQKSTPHSRRRCACGWMVLVEMLRQTAAQDLMVLLTKTMSLR